MEDINQADREGDGSQDRAQGNIAGDIEYDQEQTQTKESGRVMDGQDHSEEGGDAFTAAKLGKYWKKMSDHGKETEKELQVDVGETFLLDLVTQKEDQGCGGQSLEDIHGHNNDPGFFSEHPKSIGGTGISASMLAHIHIMQQPPDPYSTWNGSKQVSQYGQPDDS